MKKNIDRMSRLTSLLKLYEELRRNSIDLYVGGYSRVNRGAVLSDIATWHELVAFWKFFYDGDCDGMRQHFFMNSILTEAANMAGHNPEFRHIGLPSSDCAFALLSDSCDRIVAIGNASLAHKNDPKTYHFYTAMWQALLKDDYACVENMIELGREKCGKPFREELISGQGFFSLFLNGNKAELEVHIAGLAGRKITDTLRGEFLHTWAVMCAKLCWIKGIEVQIDHPLVPMALMPVKPLDHYEIEYDFLLPSWQPPRQTWFDKLKRLLK